MLCLRLFAKNDAKVMLFLHISKKKCNFAQLFLHFMEKKGIFGASAFKFVGINVLLAVVLGIVILVGLIIWLRQYTEHGVEVEVEDVRGMLVDEATPVLGAQGLHLLVIDSTYSDKVPFGTIVEQDPKPNSHAKHGRTVYVTINATTKRQVVLPDLHDISYRQAETTLRGLGLRVDSIYEYEPSAFRDLVLDIKANGNSIAPGEKIAVGTIVTLVIGEGPGTKEVEVPSVIGLTLQDARSLLLSTHLTLGAVYYDEPQEENQVQYVYQQTPFAGTRIIEGETVTLRLSPDIDKTAHAGYAPNEEEDTWF